MAYRNLQVERQGTVATVWLNRPEVRNALDEVLIAELTQVFRELQDDDAIRVLVLGGHGTVFCAGADLHWMKRMAQYSPEQNREDAMRLAEMLRVIHQSEKPVIARVHGAAFAGGMGLAAACDIVVASHDAQFCLSEVRIGLVPATISPYVVQALGVQAARRYMLTAERLPADEAFRLGFVHQLAEAGEIDEAVARMVSALEAGGPQALAQAKALMERVTMRPLDDELMQETAVRIADIRASNEGREGLSAFLEKRRPVWASV
jgi:methylglutaconyl-CoA hydratase